MRSLMRCPRCQGYLYDSVFAYRWFFRGILHCFSCARDWRIVRMRKGRQLIPFSNRREWDEQAQNQAVA
jgi:hypothetical protein